MTVEEFLDALGLGSWDGGIVGDGQRVVDNMRLIVVTARGTPFTIERVDIQPDRETVFVNVVDI
jgi:hypothetical protein